MDMTPALSNFYHRTSPEQTIRKAKIAWNQGPHSFFIFICRYITAASGMVSDPSIKLLLATLYNQAGIYYYSDGMATWHHSLRQMNDPLMIKIARDFLPNTDEATFALLAKK